ncbi:unnamed protein product, partial [marine sediment metagenome]
ALAKEYMETNRLLRSHRKNEIRLSFALAKFNMKSRVDLRKPKFK